MIRHLDEILGRPVECTGATVQNRNIECREEPLGLLDALDEIVGRQFGQGEAVHLIGVEGPVALDHANGLGGVSAAAFLGLALVDRIGGAIGDLKRFVEDNRCRRLALAHRGPELLPLRTGRP